MEKIKVSASTLAPPKEKILDYVRELNEYDIDYLHCDAMDGKFVVPTTFGYKTIKEFKKISKFPLDVHLMISKPHRFIKKYIKAGADVLTVHCEAFDNKQLLIKTLEKINALGAFAGIAINPDTEVSSIAEFLPYCTMVILMSVNPGYSGKKFDESAFERIKQLKLLIEKQGCDTLIEIDCGVNSENIKKLKQCGVDIAVVGSFLYNSPAKAEAIKALKV